MPLLVPVYASTCDGMISVVLACVKLPRYAGRYPGTLYGRLSRHTLLLTPTCACLALIHGTACGCLPLHALSLVSVCAGLQWHAIAYRDMRLLAPVCASARHGMSSEFACPGTRDWLSQHAFDCRGTGLVVPVCDYAWHGMGFCLVAAMRFCLS